MSVRRLDAFIELAPIWRGEQLDIFLTSFWTVSWRQPSAIRRLLVSSTRGTWYSSRIIESYRINIVPFCANFEQQKLVWKKFSEVQNSLCAGMKKLQDGISLNHQASNNRRSFVQTLFILGKTYCCWNSPFVMKPGEQPNNCENVFVIWRAFRAKLPRRWLAHFGCYWSVCILSTVYHLTFFRSISWIFLLMKI